METGAGAGRGSIGRDTFERVRALIDQGMKRQDAFQKVAEDTGRTAATVQTAFYRVARQQPDGGGVKQRPRSGKAQAAAAAPRRGRRPGSGRGTSIDQLAADVQRALDALVSAVKSQTADAAALRAEADQLREIKKLVGR